MRIIVAAALALTEVDNAKRAQKFRYIGPPFH